ncbi:AraC family transcriptional regulator [Sinomicrobium soli]|uniref:AraC family transcriptional regulator n=1 Tax=Sinomicrobium sp. N-1-3-6 TaxID=2219864 RepID=UPI000DCCD6D1|nr:AraC family transcriptional regulator [Sinomicrobium sp. N-1-3-6]RAV27621.1 AraC family transcriptional regulator [Sinomicrobium sp. N-1-3-6]
MKVLPFKIPKPEQEALVYQEDCETVFYDQLHQHEEIQISYIVEGAGSLIVGDTINHYQAGDILVIGENIPHVFKSDINAAPRSVMYTLFFAKNSFGREFFTIPDMAGTETFFKESEYGITVLSDRKKIVRHFNKLKGQGKISRIGTLLKIIHLIIIADKQALSSFVYRKKYTDDEGKRMNAVFNHAMQHFNEVISLDTIARKANMSKNAFCRYFKKRTNKTFFQFLIEIRIEHACKLLYRNPEMPVAIVSEMCGFQNITNFNRKFKELKGVTPTQYRMQHQK